MTIFPMKILLFTDYPAQHSVVDQMTIIVDYVSIILPPHSTPAELFIVSSISHITRVNHTSPCYSNSLIAVRSHCTLSNLHRHHWRTFIPLACKVFSIFIFSMISWDWDVGVIVVSSFDINCGQKHSENPQLANLGGSCLQICIFKNIIYF